MKPTIAAARLGDRVILFTFLPGRIKHEFALNLPRPRRIEDVAAAGTARDILQELREEINTSQKNESGVSS